MPVKIRISLFRSKLVANTEIAYAYNKICYFLFVFTHMLEVDFTVQRYTIIPIRQKYFAI